MISKHFALYAVVVAFAALLSIAIEASAQSFVKGFVYEDANRNGRKDRKERGLEGVSVSNGAEVTVTGSKGEYQLPIGRDIWSR